VDIHIVNHAGNLIDAAGLAAIAALHTAKMPEYDEEAGKVSYEKKHKKLPIKFKPVPITVFRMGDSLFLDANLEEESVMSVSMTVTTQDEGNVVALQKRGSGSLSPEEIEKAFSLSMAKGAEIRKLLEKHV
jgi:exosome complex component RRP42